MGESTRVEHCEHVRRSCFARGQRTPALAITLRQESRWVDSSAVTIARLTTNIDIDDAAQMGDRVLCNEHWLDIRVCTVQ